MSIRFRYTVFTKLNKLNWPCRKVPLRHFQTRNVRPLSVRTRVRRTWQTGYQCVEADSRHLESDRGDTQLRGSGGERSESVAVESHQCTASNTNHWNCTINHFEFYLLTNEISSYFENVQQIFTGWGICRRALEHTFHYIDYMQNVACCVRSHPWQSIIYFSLFAAKVCCQWCVSSNPHPGGQGLAEPWSSTVYFRLV